MYQIISFMLSEGDNIRQRISINNRIIDINSYTEIRLEIPIAEDGSVKYPVSIIENTVCYFDGRWQNINSQAIPKAIRKRLIGKNNSKIHEFYDREFYHQLSAKQREELYDFIVPIKKSYISESIFSKKEDKPRQLVRK